ncbi:hypothetical protein [Streptomyces sp. V4I2]|uniref:hypothetical protein n=1 Tax=Streptomyces sp. V4I2 TaxID=3042280 RepID=UPI002780BEC0|nr:hypothetical protein [Streptomyces sp. V4I2]MDQ1046422.1 hypothetical protein [Streptomyces sp. V4I2]
MVISLPATLTLLTWVWTRPSLPEYAPLARRSLSASSCSASSIVRASAVQAATYELIASAETAPPSSSDA